MTARKKRVVKIKTGKKYLMRKLFFWLVFVLAVFFIWTSIFTRSIWMKESKLVLVQATYQEKVDLLIFDSTNSEIMEFTIPENTEVEVAGNLGIRKIGKLWDLSIDERKEGVLLKQTLEKNLLLPIDGWIGPNIYLTSSNFLEKMKFVFFGKETNLNIRDRLMVFFFLIKSPKLGNQLEFKETSFLKQAIGDDGGLIYQINGEVPEKIRSYFSEKKFFDNNYKIMIKRNPENSYLSEKVGRIIEILGAKPAYSTYDSSKLEGCELFTDDPYLSTRLTNLFNCKTTNKKEGVFDAVIYIGGNFEKEF